MISSVSQFKYFSLKQCEGLHPNETTQSPPISPSFSHLYILLKFQLMSVI